MSNEGRLIVVVDDDIDFLELNRHILAKAGYRVSCHTDPNEALASMERTRPDLVITDVMMEALDSGFSFASRLRQHPGLKDVPIIIVTAASSQRGFDFRPQTSEDLAAMHADAFFEKPVPPKRLLAKVEELLAPSKE